MESNVAEKVEYTNEKSKCICSNNLSTKRGQNCQMFKIICVAVIPILVVLIQCLVYITDGVNKVSYQQKVKESISFSVELGLLVHYLQIERGTTALYISAEGDNVVLTNLNAKRKNTDIALNALDKWLTLSNPVHFQSADAFRTRLIDYRNNLDPNTTTIQAAIKHYSDDNNIIIEWVGSESKNSQSDATSALLTAYYMLLLSKEQAGIERALGSTFYARGAFPLDELLWYTEKKTLGETYLDRSMQYSASVHKGVLEKYKGTPLHGTVKSMRSTILSNNASQASVTSGILWFDNMTLFINILKDTQDDLAQEIIDSLDEYISSLERNVIIYISEMVGAIVMFPLIVYLVYRLTKKIQAFANSLKAKTMDLEIERQRSEQILCQMLPVDIAKRMMKKMEIIPQHFDSVTIYFSDIVGFTTICGRSTPMQVIHMLNVLYSVIDERLEQFDVYKVETIGDAYMVASGLPIPNNNKHAIEIALLALDVMKTVSEATVPHIPEERWKLRIGINTGPVVAGVVGTLMPRYCLFGDTVNVASRMESSGEACKIQLSSHSKKALEKYPELDIQIRGEMPIKGKGMMTTYWLLGKNNNSKSKSNFEEQIFKWCENLN